MTKDEEIDFAILQRRAFGLGLYAGMHQDFEKRHRMQGPFYIREKKKLFAGKEVGKSVCLAKYISAAEAHACFDDYEKTVSAAPRSWPRRARKLDR